MAKKTYRREELVRDDVCGLCNGYGEEHEEDCPLACPDTLAVDVRPMTKPREAVCGECELADSNCPAFHWQEHTHEDLQLMCVRYKEDTRRS